MSKLYIVATPIGNLSEITYRAVEVLQNADVILCEDIRHSLKLLNHLNISKPLKSYHKYNEREAAEEYVNLVLAGKNVALITDAGMPCISDPGNIIVKVCQDKNAEYTVISGACAMINALVLSGLPTDKFAFLGFLPERDKDKKQLLWEYKSLSTTLVFYSAPHNLNSDLQWLYNSFGSRNAVVVKEISKVYESSTHVILGQGVNMDARGEYVIVVEGAKESIEDYAELTPEQHLQALILLGADVKDAVKQVAKERGLSKNEIYQITVKK